jgi:predicted nucleic acid-binding protein
MAYLLDTGVLLRLFDQSAPERGDVLAAIRKLLGNREPLYAAVQNLAEFWNVTTRPRAVNGLGETPATAGKRLVVIERLMQIVTESEVSYVTWKRLVKDHAVVGVLVHDTRLVSVMAAEGISHLVTFNKRDFRRFGQITAITPGELLSQ